MSKIKHRAVGTSEWIEEEIEDKPLSLLCHKGDVRLKPVDQIPLNPEMTVYHGQRVVNIDPVAKAWAEHILGYELEDITPEDRDISEAHVIGLCDLPVKLMQLKKQALPFFIEKPETYLHPSQQSNIADWAITISQNTTPDGVFETMPNERN